MLNKIKFLMLTVSTVFAYSTIAYCDVQSSLNNITDKGMDIVAVIPGAMAVFSFINAGIAYSQAHQDGGNATASGKMASSLVAGVVSIAVAFAIINIFKPMVANLVTNS